jgi:tetratricopeptide (TPR) repeat protein
MTEVGYCGRNTRSRLTRWLTAARLSAAHLFAVAALTSGCSRDHIEAINLANKGDQAVKVNVAGAIKDYEEATRLDPSNHRIFWKLANAYQKQEEWDKMASTLSRASQVAPEFANYHYYRGFALVKIAEGGNKDAYEEAKKPLKDCIEKDANFAECYFWLGTSLLWTDDEQGAIQNYTKAIELDPTIPYFYPALGEVYLSLRLYDEAEKVLEEAARIIPPNEKTANSLYGVYTLLSNVHQAKGDDSARLADLEKANDIGGANHPEIAFNLGSTYAVMKPPQKEKALRLLKSFNKRACKSADAAKKLKDQCATSNDLVQKLGGVL